MMANMYVALERKLLWSIYKGFLAGHDTPNQINNTSHEFNKGKLDTR